MYYTSYVVVNDRSCAKTDVAGTNEPEAAFDAGLALSASSVRGCEATSFNRQTQV